MFRNIYGRILKLHKGEMPASNQMHKSIKCNDTVFDFHYLLEIKGCKGVYLGSFSDSLCPCLTGLRCNDLKKGRETEFWAKKRRSRSLIEIERENEKRGEKRK